ncbi:hypothetical protein RBSH_03758 [Rhodopirellula baltica SH28]|uniref:Uncharacterized protein n=1 Tax=Rhodopirellula baltica SH28 TaxID=993517 RepID=K5D2X0_RHOBT|nr:hypothetical protein RBSH_03758 [Rhodopirellula baltica SH28]
MRVDSHPLGTPRLGPPTSIELSFRKKPITPPEEVALVVLAGNDIGLHQGREQKQNSNGSPRIG